MGFSKQKLLAEPEKYSNDISVSELSNFIKLCIEKYEEAVPIISDTVYDIIYDVLKKRDPSNSILTKVGFIGSTDNKVDIPYYMGSMDKIKTKDEIMNWVKKFKGPYIVSGKLDGASALLEQKNGKQILYSRGDGHRGKDISHLIPFLNIPSITLDFCVRGELIVSKSSFKDKTEFTTPRSMVNGMVNKKNITEGNDIDFVLFEFVYYDKHKNILPEKQFQLSTTFGFKTTINKKITNSQLVNMGQSNAIDSSFILGLLLEYRQNYDYDIDGLIITNNKQYSTINDGNPEYSIAFKSNGVGKITKVKNIEWNVSKHRYLIPRIQINPIVIDGTVINYTTGFNAKFIKDNSIGIGSEIRVVRSGEVIPYIIEIISKSKPCFPDKNYTWIESGVNIIETDIGVELKIKQITNFFRTIGFKNISEGIITRLIENGFDSIKKILLITEEEMLELDGFQKILASKLYTNIHSIIDNPISIVKLMVASLSFGRGFGPKKIEKIIDRFPDILETNVTIDMINSVDGFSEKTSKQFINSLSDFKEFMEEHSFLKIDIPKKNKNGSLFTGKKVVMTGFRNSEIIKYIEANGGTITNTISKNTNLLLIKDKDSKGSKRQAAELLGIPIMTQSKFIEKYNINI